MAQERCMQQQRRLRALILGGINIAEIFAHHLALTARGSTGLPAATLCLLCRRAAPAQTASYAPLGGPRHPRAAAALPPLGCQAGTCDAMQRLPTARRLQPSRHLLPLRLPPTPSPPSPTPRLCHVSCSARPPPARGWEAASSTFQLPPIFLEYDTQRAELLLQTHIAGAMSVGMDIEWRPVGRSYGGDGRPALLQLATPHAVVLVPLQHVAPTKPPALSKLLHRRPNLDLAPAALSAPFMCGVGVDSDLEMLHNHIRRPASQPRPPGCCQAVDVGVAAARTGLLELPTQQVGLAALVVALGGPQLSKPKSIQMSDWSRRKLSAQQVEYAALDAYAGGWAAARVHALMVAASEESGGGPGLGLGVLPRPGPPPFLEWLAGEAELQEEEAARRAQQKQLLDAAALEAVRQGWPAWVPAQAVLAGMQAAVPEASAAKLRNHIKRLVKQERLVANGPFSVEGEEQPQEFQLGPKSLGR